MHVNALSGKGIPSLKLSLEESEEKGVNAGAKHGSGDYIHTEKLSASL